MNKKAKNTEEVKEQKEQYLATVTTIPKASSEGAFYEIHLNSPDFRENKILLVEPKYDAVNQKMKQNRKMIATPILVTEKVESESGNYYKVVIHDRDKVKEKYILASDLFLTGTKNSPDFDWLIKNGLFITEKCRSDVLDYLKNSAMIAEVKQGTDYSGWKDNEYISNGLNTSDMIYTGASSISFERKGSADEQKALWGDLFTYNPISFGIIAYLYGGFISKFLGEDNNQILAIVGKSSMGKTTEMKIGISGMTTPEAMGSMNATAGSINNLLKQHNDAFYCFDETGESPLKKEDRLAQVYTMANGKEKARLRKINDNYVANTQNSYRYSLLIAGEESLIKNLQATDGVKIRLNELVLSENTPIFEFRNIEEGDQFQAQKEIERINQHIQKHYGHIAPDFINLVKADIPILHNRYLEYLEAIRNDLGMDNAIANRKAKILAYIRLSADYLAKICIDEDLRGEVIDDMYLAMAKAIFASVELSEDNNDIYKDHLAHFEHTQQAFFKVTDTNLEPDSSAQTLNYKDYWGEVNITTKQKEILIINNKFSDLCTRLEIDEKVFLSYLMTNNLLVMSKDNRKQVAVSRNGVNRKYYKIIIPNDFFKEKESNDKRQAEIDPDMPKEFL